MGVALGQGGVQNGAQEVSAGQKTRTFLKLASIVVAIAGKSMLQEGDLCRKKTKHNRQGYKMKALRLLELASLLHGRILPHSEQPEFSC